MKTLFFSLILLASQGLLAQLQPQLQSGPVSADPSSWVSLTAQVPIGLPNRVVIQASLHQDGVEAWSGTSVPLGLTPGRWQILPGQLRWDMQSDVTGISGKGLLCIQILSDPGAQYLGEACVELEINSTTGVGANRNSPLRNDKNSSLQLPGLDSLPAFSSLIPSGNVELFGQSANQPMPLTDFPRHFAGVRGHAAVNTFGMPFRADLNWILAADQPVPPAWNQLSFSLDPLAMKDSIRQQILDAAETDPEAWKGRFNALREEKINSLREQYQLPAAFSQADSLLNQQIQRGQIVGRMERMLNDSDLAQTKANWESRLSDLGLQNEQQIGAYLDSLRAFDVGAYEEWLKEYARLGQIEAMEEKIAAYRQDSIWLPDWQRWEDKKEEIASWQEADPEQLLQDPSILQQLAARYKQWKWKESLHRLQVGTVFPQVVSLGFQGVQVRGLDVAVTPGNLYLSTTTGQLQPAMWGLGANLVPQASARFARATVGIGAPGQHFLHLSAQLAEEQADSLILLPRNNELVEASGGLQLLRGAISMEGQVAWSRVGLAGKVPVSDSLSSSPESSDLAWSLRAHGLLFEGASRWHLSYQKVGQEYLSLAAPWLLRNRTSIDARWEQQLFDNKLRLMGFYRQDRFAPLSRFSQVAVGQEVRAGGLQGQWTLSPQTRLTLNWSPYYQGFAGFDSSIVARQSRWQAGITHRLATEQVTGILMGQYIFGLSPRTDSSGFFLHQWMGTGQLGWRNGANLSLQLSGMYLALAEENRVSMTSFLQSGFYLMQRWRQEIGAGYTILPNQKGQAYFSTRTIIPVTAKLQLSLTFRADYFHNQPEIAELPWMYLGRLSVTYSF